jgi:predicted RNA methylase
VTPNFTELNPTHCLVVSNGDQRNDLVAAECEVLSGVTPTNGLATGGSTSAVWRAAYQQFGLQVIASAPTLNLLCTRAANSTANLDDFHIKTIAPSMTGAQRLVMGLAVADALQAGPNLKHPLHRLVVIKQGLHFVLGEITAEPDKTYLQHNKKPHRTSSSLPSRLARGLVNLLPLTTRNLLDPCCGSGSIPLEASAVGMTVLCGDSNGKMVDMAEKNLRHFGYEYPVEQRDARAWTQPVDAVVTDLPYGRHSLLTEYVMLRIFEQMAQIANIGVYVACADLSAQMLASGYASVDVFEVPKAKGFARYVHRGTTATTSQQQ